MMGAGCHGVIEGLGEVGAGGIEQATLPALPLLTEIKKDTSGLKGQQFPVFSILGQLDAEMRCDGAKWFPGHLTVAQQQSPTQSLLDGPFAQQSLFCDFRCAQVFQSPCLVGRFDIETGQAGQDLRDIGCRQSHVGCRIVKSEIAERSQPSGQLLCGRKGMGFQG